MELTKRCPCCKNEKKLDCFTTDNKKKYGRSVYCLECIGLKRKEYYKNNLDKFRQYDLDRYQSCQERKEKWKKENIEKQRLYRRRSNKKKYQTVKGRLDVKMSTSIYRVLKENKKWENWEELVGYTVDALQKHLEKQFLPGMTWENYGPFWHIDHKIPISAYNFKSSQDIDFRRCWDLKNLQPLWATDNLKKHAKLIKNFQPSFSFSQG